MSLAKKHTHTQPRTQLPQTCTLITKEKLKKGCSLCLNTSGSPNHTRRTCPKFTKFGSSTPLSLELLQSFEEKAPTLLRTNEDFDVSSILPAIPKNWQHVVITDEFLAGQLRVCEIIGLDQIGEIILTPPTFVLLGSLRERFKLNMSKPQAKKIMILALGHSAPQTAQVCPPQLQGLQNNLENIPPEKIILIWSFHCANTVIENKEEHLYISCFIFNSKNILSCYQKCVSFNEKFSTSINAVMTLFLTIKAYKSRFYNILHWFVYVVSIGSKHQTMHSCQLLDAWLFGYQTMEL